MKITGKRKTKSGPFAKKAGSRTTFLKSRIKSAWKTEIWRTSFLITSSAFSVEIFLVLTSEKPFRDFIYILPKSGISTKSTREPIAARIRIGRILPLSAPEIYIKTGIFVPNSESLPIESPSLSFTNSGFEKDIETEEFRRP